MLEVKKICIIGAGNIGVAVAVDLVSHNDISVVLLSSHLNPGIETFKYIDSTTNEIIIGNNVFVTSDYKEALEDCDLLIITVPSFLIKDVMHRVSLYEPKIILFMPGYGGKEFFCNELIRKGCIIGGFERVSHIARLNDSRTVKASKKSELNLACLDNNKTKDICRLVENLFKIKCNALKNYLTVTLTPSNPVLHTARLYSMFKDINFETPLPRQIEFYSEWNDFSSEILFQMDSELQNICKIFNKLDLTGVVSLPIHYDSETIQQLTKKITSIQSFKGILSPLVKKEELFYLDKNSRYFKEDFMYGLCNLKGFAIIANVKTPMMDKVLQWYEKISGEEFWDNKGDFSGESIKNTGVPQIFGIKTREDLYNYYGN